MTACRKMGQTVSVSFGGRLALCGAVAGWRVVNLAKILVVFFLICWFLIQSQLLAMDASARVTMKDAAKCDKRREWQNSENQENAERILHFQVPLEVCLLQDDNV